MQEVTSSIVSREMRSRKRPLGDVLDEVVVAVDQVCDLSISSTG